MQHIGDVLLSERGAYCFADPRFPLDRKVRLEMIHALANRDRSMPRLNGAVANIFYEEGFQSLNKEAIRQVLK